MSSNLSPIQFDPYEDEAITAPFNHRARLADAQRARAESVDGLNLDHCTGCGVEWNDARGFAHDVNCPWYRQ